MTPVRTVPGPERRPRAGRRRRSAALVAVAAAATLVAAAPPASAAPAGPAAVSGPAAIRAAAIAAGTAAGLPQLPGPPAPPRARPKLRATVTPARKVSTAAVTPPATARSFGPAGPASTLVLYDTGSEFGWLGELYGLAGGTLASHFGRVTAEPARSYLPGQVNDYTAIIYFGSTYDEPLPAALLSDVVSTTRPVIWSGFNVWQLAATGGAAFQAKYGWDPATSFIDSTDRLASVTYKGGTLTRSAANTAGIVAPHVVTPAAVSVLARATCSDTAGAPVACAPIAQTTGSTVPWAIRSANLTYLGEIPFPFMSESDRMLVFADLLFPALAPTAVASKRAAVRLEDVNPTSSPTALRQFADYLSGQGVPFSVGVIPQYRDPTGVFSGGVPRSVTLAQAPAVVSALRYMQSKGGTLVQHGTTHQFDGLTNPYNGVSGDDFEFYRSQCSATRSPPYSFHTGCLNTDWVILQGPVPGDSTAWAASRVRSGRSLFTAAGLGTPAVFETPHYSATAADYAGMQQVYGTRYERELFFGGVLTGVSDPSHVFGQFFPYAVRDVYGSTVLPENLGNYEPDLFNNNPPRLPADIIANARANLVVTQGVASFFYHPDFPLAPLQQTVTGIKALGYTFVPATTLP
jgi:uncharacterized protein YdaL